MAPMLTANVAGTALLKRLVERPTAAQGAALSLASVGLAVEVFTWSEHHAATRTARVLRRPGHELQRVLGTREPTETQLEVGRAALAEILRVEGAREKDQAPRSPGALEGQITLAHDFDEPLEDFAEYGA